MLNLKNYDRPSSVNAPGYFWLLNGPMEEKTIREQQNPFTFRALKHFSMMASAVFAARVRGVSRSKAAPATRFRAS